MSPGRYRTFTLAALVLVATIIVTGASVRLSGSGLGCEDWPNCNDSELVAFEDPNQAIEQINRLFTGLVSLGVIAAVLGALRRRPRRRDLIWLAWGLVGGVALQAVIGGITVLVELDWQSVAVHFLASIVLLAVAIVLHHRAGLPDDAELEARPTVAVTSPRVRRLGALIALLAAWIAVAGTLVTAAGPHGGDEEASRLDWPIPTAARLHGVSVMIFLALVLVLVSLMRSDGAPPRALRTTELLIAVGAAQALVGYLQYLNGIPALVVGIHIAGAVVVFGLVVQLQLHLAPARAAVSDSSVAPNAVSSRASSRT
jgi:heme a synthase